MVESVSKDQRNKVLTSLAGLPVQPSSSRNSFRKSFLFTTSLNDPSFEQQTTPTNLTFLNRSKNKKSSLYSRNEQEHLDKLRRIVKKSSDLPVKARRRSSFGLLNNIDFSKCKSTRGRNIIGQIVKSFHSKPKSFSSIASKLLTVEPFSPLLRHKKSINSVNLRKYKVAEEKLKLRKRPISLKKTTKLTIDSIENPPTEPKNKVSKCIELVITRESFTLTHSKLNEALFEPLESVSSRLIQETVQVVEVVDQDSFKIGKEKAKELFTPKIEKKMPTVRMTGTSKFGDKPREMSPKYRDEIFELCKERVRKIRESILNQDNLGFIEHAKVQKMMELQVKKYSIYKKGVSFYDKGIDYKAIKGYRQSNLFEWKRECVYHALRREEEVIPPLFGPSRQKFEEEELPKWLSVKLQCINDSNQGVNKPNIDMFGKHFVPASVVKAKLERYLGYNMDKSEFRSFSRLRSSMSLQLNLNYSTHKPCNTGRKTDISRLVKIDSRNDFFALRHYRSKESEASEQSSEYIEEPVGSPRRKKNNMLLTNYLTDGAFLTSSFNI